MLATRKPVHRLLAPASVAVVRLARHANSLIGPLAGLCLALSGAPASAGQPESIDVSVAPNGHWVVHTHLPEQMFSGDVNQTVTHIREADARDVLGAFHQVDFDYAERTSFIRAYRDRSVILFSTTYLSDGPNRQPFPVLDSLPSLPYQITYHDTPFSPYQFNTLTAAADSPWLFFDGRGQGFLISAANNFLTARLSLDNGLLSSGVDSTVATLPAGFTQQTILAVGSGPNQLFDIWGTALTSLHGKTRPANDADLTLKTFGYWTDNGATYYYHYEPTLGYAGTLLAVKHEYDQRGLTLGYLQLDSWWYPKGPAQRWDDRDDGIFRYRAAPDLFPAGLGAFQQQVGLPLVTHARWIDPTSPLRGEFSSSGNVMTDPRYWADLMTYLRGSGVVTYEQDWLGAQAQPVYDLAAPAQFMSGMAAAAADRDMTIQYCMPLPRHVLQTVEYNNVTSMRVSDDRFDRNRWDTFLYTSRLASALGVWPWADVFLSTETTNLLLADLSAGVVGVGDALGAEDAVNIRKVMRADAVLIKPDAPLVPTDDAMLAEARQGSRSPMVATTYSEHGAGLRAVYVFAYGRGDGPQAVSFAPAALGISGTAYVYDVFGQAASPVPADASFNTSVSSGSYYVVVPVGASGIAFLGDANAFAALGQKRISQLTDDGTLRATVEVASNEQTITLHGYAPSAPVVSTPSADVDNVQYDVATQHFSVDVHPMTTPSSVLVSLTIDPAAQP